jgi:MFS family permease
MSTAAVEAIQAGTESDSVRNGGWYTFCVILGLTLFAFVDRQLLTLVAPPLAAELRLSDGELGTVLGVAFSVFTLVAAYPIAWAADRFDRRLVLGACVAVWSIGTATCGLARNFTELFVAAVAIAAGEAGLAPIALSIIPDLFTGRKRVLANALNYIFAYLGVAAALALGGTAISQLDAIHPMLPDWLRAYSSWRLAFFIVALPAPAFLALIAFATLNRARGAVGSAPLAIDDSPQFIPFARRHARPISLILGAICCYLLSFGGYMAWLPTIATRMFGATPAQNGAGMGIATAAGMVCGVVVSTLLMRKRISQKGPSASVAICGLLSLVGTPFLFLFPFVTAAWQVYALFGTVMLAGTAIGSLIPMILQDMAPAALRARLIALYTVASGLIGGSAPTIVGWLSTSLGGSPHDLILAMTIVSIPSWIAATLLFWTSERSFSALIAETSAG